MKHVHADWHDDCKVTCSCGNSFVIGSTSAELTVDICNKCHPFFTGELRFVDRQGRVDKFLKKMAAAKTDPKAKKTKKVDDGPSQSYQEILRNQQTAIRSAAKQQKAQ
ncbi:MAG: 50S ribosomal protein L31 [Candidatus Pacebacteria bacterium]|nr:50S ribosomal protein L31 [Candidatus Paceibacterota bacterium]PIR61093.1 MAG: 50S ribosomal protein L31 [Candidatus Pacebacteria bacterium CG10_big_fil_rev_8_21_14_0_10_45_6]